MAENRLENGKIPITLPISLDSSCKDTENRTNSKISLYEERESNCIEGDRNTMVHNSGNEGSNSPTYSFPYSVHTCLKGNGKVAPNEQAIMLGNNGEYQTNTNELEFNSPHIFPRNGDSGNLIENSDPNLDVSCQNGQAIKLREEVNNDNISSSITNELECGVTVNLDDCNEPTPMETEFVNDSCFENNQSNVNMFSDLDSSSNESNKIPSLLLKRWEDSPSENSWYNLKPCSVVLQRCDINENYSSSKSLNSNTLTDQMDNISVLSDVDDESADFPAVKRKLGKLRSKKPHSKFLKNKGKERSSFPSLSLLPTIKGTSRMRKNNSKVVKNISDTSKDSDIDNGEPNNFKRTCNKTTIEVSAQIHNPPESDNDSEAIAFCTSSKISENEDMTVEINSNISILTHLEENGKRERNSSSISSMSFSELYSDTEYIGSKRRIIRPSASLLSSTNKNKNQETEEGTSDLDVSDNLHITYQSSEMSEKLLTGSGNEEILSDSNNAYIWPNQSDIDISSITFKPCCVVLNRCDDQVEIHSSEVTDVNSRNQPTSRRSDSNLNFCGTQNQNICNLNRNSYDSFLSDLSDTDEIMSSPKKISLKQKKNHRCTKKKRPGLKKKAKLPAHQKLMNKSLFQKEIIELKNTMKRVEKKLDKLIELHLHTLDSD